MTSERLSNCKLPRVGRYHFWLMLTALSLSGTAWGECPAGGQNIPIDCPDPLPLPEDWDCSIAATPGQVIDPDNEDNHISHTGSVPGNLFWELAPGTGCSGSSTSITCLGMVITLPAGATTTGASQTDPVILNGTAQLDLGESQFTLTVTDADDTSRTCNRVYKPRVTTTTASEGEPHIRTVDGIEYDFQSVGEFIALRGEGIQIQTRQTAISSQTPASANTYTGISSCFSINTAVALSVGTQRVTIQPNISGVPDPSGLQIRVDGELKYLGAEGIDLSSCDDPSTEIQYNGRIQRAADDESIEILYTDGTRVVVTPRWGRPVRHWVLDVNIYNTIASEGVMGRTTDSWLPALPNGRSLGQKPSSVDDRYDQLYETFADSWRVTNDDGPKKSLFDYAPGTSSATFTIDEWPRKNASTVGCLLEVEGEEPLEPMDEDEAKYACKNVVDLNKRNNCIFDVKETGDTGFADAYERSEQLIPGATRTLLIADKSESTPGSNVTFTANVQRAVSTIGNITSGRVQFALNGISVGSPVAFDENGNTTWSTSGLPSGSHEVEARFLPSVFGETFRASSGKINHLVSSSASNWWLSFHAGTTAPSGSLSNSFDGAESLMLDLEYEVSSTLSVVGLLGYNKFKGANSAIADTEWNNLSANVRYYYSRFTDGGSLWVNGGFGAYKPESGSSEPGANVGLGIGYDISPRWRGEFGVNYHSVFTSGSNTEFFTPQIGITYNF